MDDWLPLLDASPSFATRLLAPLSSTAVAAAPSRDISQFLSALAPEERALAVDGVDLLSGGYLAFVRERLPPLLASLRSLRSDELAEVGPALVGQPVWGRTVLGWTSGALPPDRVVSRVQVRTLELPENQALRLLVRHLALVAGSLASRLGLRAHADLRELAGRAAAALREPAMRAISDVAGPSEQLLRAAEGSREPVYREVGDLLRRRLALSGVDDLARWRRTAFAATLGGSRLAPIAPEDVFELLGLARTMDALEHDLSLGAPTSYWMRIGAGRQSGPVAAFSDGAGGSVDVYFNRTPAFLMEASTAYARVTANHEGLGRTADRRPDIVLVRHAEAGRRRVFFLEVKLPGTADPGSYLRESIYKAFGYLYDFAPLFSPDQFPKVALFVPYDAGPRPHALRGSDLLIVSPRRPGDLAAAISRALELP